MSFVVITLCHLETFNMFHLYKGTMEGWRKEIYPEYEEENKKKMIVTRDELVKQDCQWLLASEK